MFKKIVGLGFSSKGKKAKDVDSYIDSLVDSGATEFFTGYNPEYWSSKFGFEVSPNGRFAEHEQIIDFETLKSIVERVHYHNLEIFINLNAWYYTNETFPLIEKMVKEFEEIGIDGIICGNISILEYLKENKYKGKINISTIMAVYNKEAIGFFIENYDINKVILSREITLKEIEEIVTSFSDVKFEVFGEGDFCRYNNGLCFAEHKYGSKDICSVVVNDLVIKKRFKPDFKKLILDDSLDTVEKLRLLDNDFEDDFNKMEKILEFVELGLNKKEDNLEVLLRLINKVKNKENLYYDSLKSYFDKNNQNIVICLKVLKYILENFKDIENKENLEKLKKELDQSIRSGMEYYNTKLKELSGKTNVQAKEKQEFYSRSSNLNLYSYLFFSKFKNIETVKFPTRGRIASQKLKLIEKTINDGNVDKSLFDRGSGLDRIHYDLTYLFGDKLWFRDMLKED